MQIVPMRDLKNTVEIERKCAESNEPVFVTKNGYGRLVVMNIDYSKLTAENLEVILKNMLLYARKNELKTFKVTCFKCGKEFKVQEREKTFPKREKYFCSKSCANSHIKSKESKEKISKGLYEFYAKIKKNKNCKYCGKEIPYNVKYKFCSDECRRKWKFEYYF